MLGRGNRFRGALAALAVGSMLGVAATAASAAYFAAGSLVGVDVYDRQDGRSLEVYSKDGRSYVIGTPGHEYAVRIRNNSGERILAVTSVDGVNVISGETASPDQSGYVIYPYGSVEIAGWRKSMERTAAFYFTDLGDSYAVRTGRPFNVGVIGVAVFRERRQPPISYYRDRERRIANAQRSAEEGPAADSRAEPSGAPAATVPAPPPVAQGGSVEPQDERGQPESKDDALLDRRGGRLASKLGTGHGRSEESYAQQVRFERASSSPDETVAIQYDRRENLMAMGVLPRPRYAQQRNPDPFPGSIRFAPDPR
jgi:hypothetical protein